MAQEIDHTLNPGAHHVFVQPGLIIPHTLGIGIDPGPPEPTGFFLKEIGGFILLESNSKILGE